ncbi:MAG: response regulator transcription factor [Gammaproteobacteria bacterium]|jgi:DNA-binding NarL/FixJ family response regulator
MKALIIDDHPVFIAALETLLKNMYQDIGIDTATSAEAALRHIEYHPDYQFILLDLTMPGLDGFAFLRALEQRKLPIPIIIISSCEVPETIHACINAGAVGYIPKSYDLEQMAQAIERIHDGEIYLPQALTQTSAQTDEAAVRRRCEQIGITTKTYQVLVWLAKGKTNKEIADELNISVHTVKAHLAKLYERLQTGNRMDTAMEAIRLGLIDG